MRHRGRQARAARRAENAARAGDAESCETSLHPRSSGGSTGTTPTGRSPRPRASATSCSPPARSVGGCSVTSTSELSGARSSSRCCRRTHHVVWWEDGGDTDIDDLVLLCSHHHRRVHSGGLVVKMDEGLPRFWNDFGLELVHPEEPPLRERSRSARPGHDHNPTRPPTPAQPGVRARSAASCSSKRCT